MTKKPNSPGEKPNRWEGRKPDTGGEFAEQKPNTSRKPAKSTVERKENTAWTPTMGLLLRTLFVEISNRPIQISGPESSRPSCILSSIVPSCLQYIRSQIVWFGLNLVPDRPVLFVSGPRSSRPVCHLSQIVPYCLYPAPEHPILSDSCRRSSRPV